jgi:signal transduction histidine kinase
MKDLTLKDKQKYLVISICMLCVAGIAISLCVKWQNETPGYQDKNFDHAYFQTFFLSVGKSLAFVVYSVKKFIYREEQQPEVITMKENKAINSDISEDEIVEVFHEEN